MQEHRCTDNCAFDALERESMVTEPRTETIPTWAMLDVWLALGGDGAAFDRMWAEDRRTPADTWAQLMAMVRRSYGSLMEDTNPPAGPEFEALIVAGDDTVTGGTG